MAGLVPAINVWRRSSAAARVLRVGGFPRFAGAEIGGAIDLAAIVVGRAILGQADEAKLTVSPTWER